MAKNECKNELQQNNNAQETEQLPDVFIIEKTDKPLNIYDTTIWAEAPHSRNEVVLNGYVSELSREGLSPEEIASRLNLPVIEIRRKLNVIANSFLGKIEPDAKAERRIEVDNLITEQLIILKERHELELSMVKPDLKLLNAISGTMTKLIQARMVLWGLNNKNGDGDDKSPKVIKQTNIQNNINNSSSADKVVEGMNKLADFIVGVHNGKSATK